MNRVELVGRLTKDPELKKTQSGLSVCQFTLAVNRPKKKDQDQAEADFITCVAWRGSADYLTDYGTKGALVALEGKIQTRNYDDRDGHRVYVTEIVADALSLISSGTSKSSSERNMATGSLTRDQISKDINNGDLFDTGPDAGITADDLPF